MFGRMIGSLSSNNLADLQNSYETQGGISNPVSIVLNSETYQAVDTEPGEINDETTPCGCLHNKFTPGASRPSTIPLQNIQKLKQSKEITTMRDIIYKHLQNFIRKRLIIFDRQANAKNKHNKV